MSYKIINNEEMKALSSKVVIKILRELNNGPKSVKELSEILKLHEQTIYYYIKKLHKFKIVEVLREVRRRGMIEKIFYLPYKTFILNISKTNKKYEKEELYLIENFFKEFFTGNYFDGYIVVGSPQPHGPFLTSTRDSHLATQIAFLLGKFCEVNKLIIKLDTEIKNEKLENNNLIVIGGALSNIISYELNNYLDIKFKWDKSWYVDFFGEKFLDEEVALIAKVKNPWNENKKIILIAGNRLAGTRAAIYSLTTNFEKILENYKEGKDFYCVIKGVDKDGDGFEEDVKILKVYNK